MQTVIEKTIVTATPQQVWKFLTSIQEGDNYKRWHPQDHIKCICSSGDGVSVGSQFYAEEYIGKRILKLPYQLNKAVENEFLEYTAQTPLSLLNLGKGYFKIEIEGVNTSIIALVEYGWDVPIIGTLIDSTIEMYFKKKDLQKHMQEEGMNMKKIVEA